MNPYKGVDNLLKIVKRCPFVQFDVVGRVDPLVDDLVCELESQPNVKLNKNYVTDDEMKSYFMNADWVILPYNTASQSGVIIDSYKYSRPVIAFDVGAVSEQIEDYVSGYLVEADNIDIFCNTLKYCNSMSFEEYQFICHGAYQYGLEKYSSEYAKNKFYEMIRL